MIELIGLMENKDDSVVQLRALEILSQIVALSNSDTRHFASIDTDIRFRLYDVS
jgi:hypothetical protein